MRKLGASPLSPSSIALAIIALLMSAFIIFVNVLTIVVIRRTPSLRTLSNTYVISLALSDMVVGVCLLPLSLFYVPVTRTLLFDHNIRFCVLVFGINLGVAVVSNINMTLIAADRYIYIVYPYTYQRVVNQKCVLVLLACAWGFGVIYALVPQINQRQDPGVQSCDATLVLPAWYLSYTNLTIYSVLVIVDLILYTNILCVACRQQRVIDSMLPTTATNAGQHVAHVILGHTAPEPYNGHQTTTKSLSETQLAAHSSAPISIIDNANLLTAIVLNIHNHKDDVEQEQSSVIAIRNTEILNQHMFTVNKKSTSKKGKQQKVFVTTVNKGRLTPRQQPTKQVAGRMKSVKFFMTVFGAYFTCMTPAVVCMSLDYYVRVPTFAYNMFNLLALLNSGVNFIIYLILNPKFKVSVQRYLGINKNTFAYFTDESNPNS
ncbi:hypothetical protein Btru_000279 [Bulinus truncatus]|nr:hypothetical protein Btru_000279 [Bulinus truncatus]